jgi:hypothetical protein
MTALRHLDLSYNNLTGTLPAEWSNLHKLQTIKLAGNRDLRGTVPESWSVIADYRGKYNDVDVDVSYTYISCVERGPVREAEMVVCKRNVNNRQHGYRGGCRRH